MRGDQRRSVSMGGRGGLEASGADVRGVLGGASRWNREGKRAGERAGGGGGGWWYGFGWKG
jgi:hypothetical protein